MPINLRTDEAVQAEVHFHWLTYLTPGVALVIGVLVLLGGLSQLEIGTILVGLILSAPFVYVYFANKYKKYIVTNQRIYIETGIIARSENEIPLKKVNNVILRQSVLQRMFGAGTVLVLVGNDNPTIIPNIENPKIFKEMISTGVENIA